MSAALPIRTTISNYASKSTLGETLGTNLLLPASGGLTRAFDAAPCAILTCSAVPDRLRGKLQKAVSDLE